jgi:ABC-type lipoprotein export system ATPase subunit
MDSYGGDRREGSSLIATHDEEVLPYLDHVYAMADGRLDAAGGLA